MKQNDSVDHFERVQKMMKAEHELAFNANAMVATAAFQYACIDAMGWAAMPAGKKVNTRTDFIGWVDTYMTPYPPKKFEYHYTGADLYQARCSLLHSLTSETNGKSKHFGYVDDNVGHRYRPDIDPNVVIIALAILRDDFFAAVARFVAHTKASNEFTLVGSRFAQIYAVSPLAKQ